MPSHERFLGRLNGLKQLPDSGGYLARWEARCPAHDDRTPSLSISLAPEGHLLVHCHAGCDTKAVMSAVGLEMGDLFPSSSASSSGPSSPASFSRSPSTPSPAPSTPAPSKKADPEKSATAKPPSRPNTPLTKTGRSRRLTDTYDYYDAQGTLLYQVVRFDPKGFRQRRPNPKGGWTWSVKGIERVPYFLPEMLEAIGEGHPIVIVEGEKDAETALQMRSTLDASSGRLFSATTAPGGAGKWLPSFSPYFEGAHVWIVPDIDEAGFHHAQQVTQSLSGVAASIKVLRLPSTKEHFDLSEWAADGGSAEDLLRIADQSPYLLNRAHPTHEVAFDTVPGPSASLEEIQAYLVSAGSVRSGQARRTPFPKKAATKDASFPFASEQPAEKATPTKAPALTKAPGLEKGPDLEKPGANPPMREGIGVELLTGEGALETGSSRTVLDSLDRIAQKSRNGEVGYSLSPSIPDSSASPPSASPPSEPDPLTSPPGPAGPHAQRVNPKPAAPSVSTEEAPSKSGSPEPEPAQKTQPETAEAPLSPGNAPREDGPREEATSLTEATSSGPESSFSAETRAVVALLEEEGAYVLSAGGAFYLVFPFLSSKQTGGLRPPSFSGKAYPLESPLVVPLLLRLVHDRKKWIPDPGACRAALLFLTPAVPASDQVSSRVAARSKALYIDAGENTILEVGPGAWQVGSSAPAVFLRSEHTRPLPRPKKRGSLAPLRTLFHIEADAAWIGIRGWLLGALCPTGPVPPLLLEGDHPRRLARLAHQLVSVLDPRSRAPLSGLHPLLSAGDLSGSNFLEGFPQREPPPDAAFNQKAGSPGAPFAACRPASRLTTGVPAWLGPMGEQLALQAIGNGPLSSGSLSSGSLGSGSSRAERGRRLAARPLGTRLVLVGPAPGLSPALRNAVLRVRPTFLKKPSSVASAEPDSTGPQEESFFQRNAHSEALGVLLAGAAEALDRAEEASLPVEAQKSQYAAFLAWVAAAEAGLSPTALGSGLSGGPSRSFVDVWNEGHRPPSLLHRLIQKFRRWFR